MKVKKFETVYGVVIVVIEEEGMLSFYGQRSSDDLLHLVGYRGSIEDVTDDDVASIASQYEEIISDKERALDEAAENNII